MKNIIITFLLLCLVIASIILIDKKINKLEIELITTKEKVANDSILVSQYQSAMYEFIQTNPDCANKFQKLLEKRDLK